MPTAKPRHLVKCEATGLFFAGISGDQEILQVAKSSDKAEPLADEQAAIYTAEFLKHAHGSFAWAPAYA